MSSDQPHREIMPVPVPAKGGGEPKLSTAEKLPLLGSFPSVVDPSQNPPPETLTPEEQMARFAKELKENDWGHQPC